MPNIPLIDPATGLVVNLIVAEYSDPPLPGFDFGPEGGQIGQRFNGTVYTLADGSPLPDDSPPAPPSSQQAPHVID